MCLAVKPSSSDDGVSEREFTAAVRDILKAKPECSVDARKLQRRIIRQLGASAYKRFKSRVRLSVILSVVGFGDREASFVVRFGNRLAIYALVHRLERRLRVGSRYEINFKLVWCHRESDMAWLL